jgi:hypothetical protein
MSGPGELLDNTRVEFKILEQSHVEDLLHPDRLVMAVSGTEFLESIRKDRVRTTPLP